MASTSTKMTDHMSICAQGMKSGIDPVLIVMLRYGTVVTYIHSPPNTDPKSPVVKYKPRKLNRLLHPRTSRSHQAGRQDREADMMRQHAREIDDASKQSSESRRSQDRRSNEASR